MSPIEVAILVGAGFVAGFVNAVAGGGSAVTIPILVEMLGASIANGTNRIAILLANIVATRSYTSGGAMRWRAVAPLIVPTVAGAVGGALVASQISAVGMRRAFSVVLILVALSVALRPNRWVKEREARLREPWRSLAFLAIGFYGGFVQAGVGFLLLAGLVLGGGLDLVRANAAKVALIATYSTVALLVFARAAQVDVGVGLVLALGNMSGAWAATKLALREGATSWIRWLLVIAALAAALRMAFVL